MTNSKYNDWFDLGAKNFRGWVAERGAEELLPDDDDGTPIYICPLCTRGLTKTALIADPVTGDDPMLTGEDVPPASIGGRKILLTCKKPCNNDQGSAIDKHAPLRESWLDSHTGGPVTPIRGEHTFHELTVRGRIWPGAGGYGFECVPAWNDPKVHQAYVAAMKDRSKNRPGAIHTFSERPGFVPERADLSYIRAAYLTSFAVFGYSHILRPNYKELRQWLAAGEHPTELPPILRSSIEDTSRPNEMFIVTEHGPQQGILLFTMGRYMVALPGPDDRRSLEEVADALAAVVPNGGSGTFSGYTVPWPTEPQHAWDPFP